MLKIDFWKDLQKILMGFFLLFGICNGYFAISGNLPVNSTEGFTVQIAGMAAVFSLLVPLFLIYRMYLKKGSAKITFVDSAKILSGVLILAVGGTFKSLLFMEAGLYFVLLCIFLYLGFVKNNTRDKVENINKQ